MDLAGSERADSTGAKGTRLKVGLPVPEWAKFFTGGTKNILKFDRSTRAGAEECFGDPPKKFHHGIRETKLHVLVAFLSHRLFEGPINCMKLDLFFSITDASSVTTYQPSTKTDKVFNPSVLIFWEKSLCTL